MKKKGFTLIELLAVLVILGLLAILMTPAVFHSINDFKIEAEKKQITAIEMAAEDWISDNLVVLPQNMNDTIYITLGDLKSKGYIDKNLRNPKNNQFFPNDMVIEIHRKKNDYKVVCHKDSGTEGLLSNLKEDGPSIQLNGDSVVTVKAGSNYVDSGAVAYDNAKNNITSSMTNTYKLGTNTVSSITTTAGNIYTIYYKVTFHNITQVVTRNVIVTE